MFDLSSRWWKNPFVKACKLPVWSIMKAFVSGSKSEMIIVNSLSKVSTCAHTQATVKFFCRAEFSVDEARRFRWLSLLTLGPGLWDLRDRSVKQPDKPFSFICLFSIITFKLSFSTSELKDYLMREGVSSTMNQERVPFSSLCWADGVHRWASGGHPDQHLH